MSGFSRLAEEDDEESEDENETDNDHSGSDPDFRGPHRTVRLKSVYVLRLAFSLDDIPVCLSLLVTVERKIFPLR